MVSAVRLRPNHYETLGLSPSASDDDIRRAFTRMMGMFGAHPVAAATSVSAAFEVLRNPAKRRAYDRDLGLLPEPKSAHWKVAGVGWSSPGLMGSAWAAPAKPEASESDAPAPPEAPAPDAPAEATQAKPAEPRLASFISSSLRDLARPIAPEIASDVRSRAGPAPVPAESAKVAIERDTTAAQRTEAEMTLDEEASPLDLRRPALVALGAIAAAGLIGAIAGASVGAQEQAPAAKRVTVTLPVAAPKPSGTMDAPIATAAISETPMRRPARAGADTARASDQRAERRQLATSTRLAVETSPLADGSLALAAAASSDVPAESAADAPKAISASMPLPGRVIARTIARIGYSCGTVVSTTTAEGAAPGVYNVACSSGQTFQATPVRGRYRFRRQ